MPNKNDKKKSRPPVDVVEGVSIRRPVLFTSVASLVSRESCKAHGLDFKSVPKDHTHVWTVSFGSPNNDDLSWVKKVEFKLHYTYGDGQIRVIDKPPFEVNESGYGEFEVRIRVYPHFWTAAMGHTFGQFHHWLMFCHTEGTGEEIKSKTGEREPVRNISYDEMVFNNPATKLYELLTTRGDVRLPKDSKPVKMEEEEMIALDRAIVNVQDETAALVKDIEEREKEIATMRRDLLDQGIAPVRSPVERKRKK